MYILFITNRIQTSEKMNYFITNTTKCLLFGNDITELYS